MTSSASAVREPLPRPPPGSRSRPCRGTADGRWGSRRPAARRRSTGTWSSSANRTRSFEQRARRTPAPARITGRSAAARRCRTARTSPAAGHSGWRRTTGTRVPSGSGRCEDVLGQGEERGPGSALDGRPDGGLERRRRPSPGRRSRPPTSRACRWCRRGRPPGTPRGPGRSRSTWPTSTNIGVESAVAVWIPIARLAAPDRAGPEARGRPAGQLPVRLGGERGGALVARRDDADPRRVQRVEHRQEALAGDGERDPDAGRPQGRGDQLGDRRRAGRVRRRPRRPRRSSTRPIGPRRPPAVVGFRLASSAAGAAPCGPASTVDRRARSARRRLDGRSTGSRRRRTRRRRRRRRVHHAGRARWSCGRSGSSGSSRWVCIATSCAGLDGGPSGAGACEM